MGLFENALTTDLDAVQKKAPRLKNRELTVLVKAKNIARSSKLQVKLTLQRLTLFYRLLSDPRSPWLAKAIASLCVGYVFSPIQLIPSFIPIIGQLDDFFVISLGMKLICRFTPSAVVERDRRVIDGLPSPGSGRTATASKL